MEKVYISKSNTGTFVCPNCQNTITVDVTRYALLDKTVKVKSKCACGHTWTSVLEKRRQYRKAVDLPGVYHHLVDGKTVDKGIMTVKDLSAKGLKLKLSVARKIQLEDRLLVEFHLDDRRKTLIEKVVIVRNIKGPFLGTAFSPEEPDDPALGFYLLK